MKQIDHQHERHGRATHRSVRVYRMLDADHRAWMAFCALADERATSARSTFTWMVAQCLALEGRTLADPAFDRRS